MLLSASSPMQLQSHPDVRKRALEFRDNGQNVAATQDCGRGDDKFALRGAIFARRRALDFRDLFHDPTT
jgi:hypothetical protein